VAGITIRLVRPAAPDGSRRPLNPRPAGCD